MARVQEQSDRNFSADTPIHMEDGCLARLLEQGEIAELFDAAARRRFGQIISTAALKPAKRHRRDRAA
jgi:hypothetical protein